jgi:hypothetical protein
MSNEPVAGAPPRILLGATLLFWGGVNGHPVVGLLCAFLVEARWWIGLRWNTGERGFVRGWHLSVVLMVLASAWLWLVGESVLRLFDLLIWMPVLFLPVILTQQYALRDTMPLNTFSFVARRKMQSDRAVGRTVHPILVHVGYAYFCLVLLAAALSKPPDMISFIGMSILGVVAVFFSSPLGRRRPFSWAAAVVVVMSISLCGVIAMRALFTFLSEGAIGRTGNDGVGDEARTAIGSISQIKQSYRIRWRVTGVGARPFSLFRTASFNQYGSGIWNHKPVEFISRDLDYDEMVEGDGALDNVWVFEPEDLRARASSGADLRFRGEAREKTALPLPETTRVLRGLAVDGVTWNPLGTVVAENPDYSVIDYQVVLGDENLTESPPDGIVDLHVPKKERAGLERTCLRLQLRDLPDKEKIDALRLFFRENFKYTLDLNHPSVSGPMATMAITRFLEVTKEGHCEYYGSTAALLLRQAGVPTRYCEGFSAQERDLDRDEWILRGRHAHAWCRAYIGGRREASVLPDGSTKTLWSGGRWVDVDLTPPAWFGLEGSAVPWQRILLDKIQRAREDFLLWRTQPANRRLVDLVMATIAILLFAYVAVRVWKTRTRRRMKQIAGFRTREDVPVTPLHGLERLAEPWLGARPSGAPLTRWLGGLADQIPETDAPLIHAVTLHRKIRFDPVAAQPDEREQLDALCRDLRRHIKARKR